MATIQQTPSTRRPRHWHSIRWRRGIERFCVPADQDAFTLPELLDSVTREIWSKLEEEPEKKFSTRRPMISYSRSFGKRSRESRSLLKSSPVRSESAHRKGFGHGLCLQSGSSHGEQLPIPASQGRSGWNREVAVARTTLLFKFLSSRANRIDKLQSPQVYKLRTFSLVKRSK